MVVRRINNELYHHGVKGQRWGIRRYQNPDGTLTAEGKKRYGTIENFNKAMKKKKIAKAVAITAGVTVAAAAAYLAANKYITENVDLVIKNPKVYRSVVEGADTKPGRMYVANNIFDKKTYQSWVAGRIKNTGAEGSTFTYKMDKMKIASNKTARKHFENLYNNDSEFKTHVDEAISRAKDYGGMNIKQRGTLLKAGRLKDAKDKYDAFNYLAVDSNDNTRKAFNKFYQSLKNEGFNTIHDINDSKLSGFNTKAKIVFDTSKTSVIGKEAFNDYTKGGKEKINKINAAATAITLGKAEMPKILGGLGAVSLAATGNAYEDDITYALKNRNKKNINTK
jgi:uncharacterized protein (UPF0297 family)